MRMHRKTLRFETLGGEQVEIDLKLRKVIPALNLRSPKDLALDFAYVMGQVLGADESAWRGLHLAISRSVPEYILHQFYDPALFYAALRIGQLPRFGGFAGERIVLRLVAGLPEVLVKYRFYLGFAKADGEIELVNAEDKEIRPTIADPYLRLFSLQDLKVLRQAQNKFGATVILRRPGEDYIVTSKKGVAARLGFQTCLSRIIRKDSRVKHFLRKVYKDIRIQEVHAGRLADNAVLEVDDLITRLVGVINYLFTHDLDLPYERRQRGPFQPAVFRIAGSREITKDRALSQTQLVKLAVEGTEKWYRTTPQGVN